MPVVCVLELPEEVCELGLTEAVTADARVICTAHVVCAFWPSESVTVQTAVPESVVLSD